MIEELIDTGVVLTYTIKTIWQIHSKLVLCLKRQDVVCHFSTSAAPSLLVSIVIVFIYPRSMRGEGCKAKGKAECQ